MSWEQWLDAFLEEVRQTQSANTLDIRQRWLRRFVESCRRGGVANPQDVGTAQVDAFRDELLWRPQKNGQLLSQNTVDQGLLTVRLWMRWATRRGHLLLDPTEKLVLPQRTRALSRYLTMAEVEQLLATPNRSTPSGLRAYTVLEMLYSTGMRRGECHRLDLADVNFEARTIRVLGKGTWERLLPMGETLAAALHLYLQECRPHFLTRKMWPRTKREDQAFFLSKAGSRYSLQSISKLVETTAKEAGIEDVNTHTMRHAFATHLLESGADFFAVQALLGHFHPGSTEIYTPVEHQVLLGTFRLTHPRAGRKTPPHSLPPALQDPPHSSLTVKPLNRDR